MQARTHLPTLTKTIWEPRLFSSVEYGVPNTYTPKPLNLRIPQMPTNSHHTAIQVFLILKHHFEQDQGLSDITTFTKLLGDAGCFPDRDGLENFLAAFVNSVFRVNLDPNDFADADLGTLATAIATAEGGQ